MQKNLENKVFAYCNRHQMFQKGDRVVLGVSGGADSVCLLFVLLALRKEWDLKLYVVHVNHGIRPDAGQDLQYVKQLCTEHALPFFPVEREIPALAAQLGISEEEAGRRARYEAFAEVLQSQKADKIAVAHNANDRAETMLFHLLRGTGLTGLGSIRPVREQIVRPLLCLEREEIEGYLAQRQLAYRHDSTNDSDDYTRNKIRHHMLKYAKEEIVGGCVGNMNRTADILAETENYIEEQINAARKDCVTALWGQGATLEADAGNKGYRIDCEKFYRLHSMLQKRLLLQLLKELSPMHKDIAAVHVEDVQSLFLQTGNRCIHLPYEIRAYREYDGVILDRCAKEASERQAQVWEPVTIDPKKPGAQELIFPVGGNHKLVLRVISVAREGINCKDIPQNQYTKWFDYDKIKECLMFRTRRSGDYLCIRSPKGMQHKKLKDYMIGEKIPQRYRDEIPLLAAGSHVLWLVGYRISEYFKIEENTKQILQVCYVRAPEEEKTGERQEATGEERI